MNAIPSVVIAVLMLMACGSLALPRGVLPGSVAASIDPLSSVWRLVTGVLVMLLAVLNANLWVPAQGIFVSLALLSVMALIRAVVFPTVRNAFMWPTLAACAVVGGAALILALRVHAFGLWLLEGPNHDSLFYFQGAIWAWAHPVHVDPATVNEAWHLGTCNQGAVYIGNDCIGYRSGTYTLLTLANGVARGGSGNATQLLAALAALFPLLALLPAIPGIAAPSRLRSAMLIFGALALMAGLIFVSPGLTGSITNANVGTAFGSACVAMVFGLAIVPCPSPLLRAFALGVAAAIAGHLYGEAAVPAGYFAALGVVIDAVRTRRFAHFFLGGAIAFATFMLGLNVVAVELVESFTAISAIAQGGEWAGWYLHAPIWTWIAAPFSGLLLGIDPPVTRTMLLVGGALSVLVTASGLTLRQTRLPAVAFWLLVALLVGYVELRAYAYGEHKVLQLLGPAAYMLAAVIVAELLKRSDLGRRRWGARLLAALIVLLMLACAGLFARRVSTLLRDSIPLHGLARDFEAGLRPIGNADTVVIDDLGTVSVEKFQKTHYLGFLLRMLGASTVLPAIDDDVLRGGYLRNMVADTLRSTPSPRWLLRLRSEAGARSVFDYPAWAVATTSEYDVVDLSRTPAALVAGNGWYGCETSHCWTRAAFEIESVVTPQCAAAGRAQLTMDVSFFSPPPGATFTANRVGGWTQTYSATDGKVTIPLPPGWMRTTVKSGWTPSSPQMLGMSMDSRALFAMVRSASVECGPPSK